MKSIWSFLQTGGEFEPTCSSIHPLPTLLPPPDPNQQRYRLNFAGLASNHLLINDVVLRVHAGISGLGIKRVTWNQLKTMPGQRNRPHVTSQVNNTCPGRYGKLNSRWVEWKAHGLQLERLRRTMNKRAVILCVDTHSIGIFRIHYYGTISNLCQTQFSYHRIKPHQAKED